MIGNISVFIPAYNEEANIEDVVKEANYVLKRIKGKHEIVVLNDGSTDDSALILAKLKKEIPILRVIEHKKNEGIGSSLVDGFSHCTGDFIFFNSADKQAPMEYLFKMLPFLEEYGFIVGYFKNRKDSFRRILLSRCYHLFAKALFGINLHNINALKLFKREIFDSHYPWGRNLCIDTELAVVAQRRGYRIYEVPLEHFPRRKGKSSVVSFNNTCATFYNILKLYIKINRKGACNVG